MEYVILFGILALAIWSVWLELDERHEHDPH